MTMVTPASSDNLLITIKSRSVFVFTQKTVHAVNKRRLHTHKQKFSVLAVSAAFKESKLSFESGRNEAPCVYFSVSPDFGHVQTLPDMKKIPLQNHCLRL